ncbi:ATP-dependent Clp protease ATP-binding subunit CLPT1, chloroplastic-like [Typha angustifolia]|uniref:ATP-dependent Clp protease ATP-binding subunit CLPT1, chloroplastic-like n=1 Tax=Typha angustifolia TaxID=59011 RepID=UPI003C2BF54D
MAAARALFSSTCLPISTTSYLSFPTTSSSIPISSSIRTTSLKSSLLGCPLPLSSSLSFASLSSTPRRRSTTVFVMLPTAKPERIESEKTTKWSARAVKAFSMAELEARKLKYPNTGTEALLMGILVEGTSEAAKFLRANGVTLFQVRDETVKLLGKSDMYFFSPEHPPLTEPAQRALDWAVDEKLKSGKEGEITVTLLLLGIWSEKDSAGHKILASLGFNDEKASELAKSANKDY